MTPLTNSNSVARSKVRRREILGGAIVLVLLWIGLRWISGGKIEPGLAAARIDQVPNRALGVVRAETIPERREVIGSIQSRVPVQASSRIAARVVQVKVRAGDRVKAGQVLVELDTSDLNAQLAHARGELAAAQAEMSRASADDARFSALFARGSVTAREHDSAEAAYKAAAARGSQAKAAVEAARSAFDYAIVRAAASATVVERMVEAGDLAMPGKPLVVLYDETALRAELEAPEELARALAVGAAVDLRTEASDTVYHATINEIVPAANAASRTFLVRAAMPSGQHLKPGMFVRGTIETGSTPVLTIPRSAVQEIGQLETVRVYCEGRLQTRMVSLGRPVGDRVEVLAGLREGERLMLEQERARK